MASLKRQIKTLKNKISRLRKRIPASAPSFKTAKKVEKEHLIKQLSKYFKGQTLEFIATQIRLADVPPNARKWNEKTNALALSLSHASPKAYRMLSRLFILPSESTLRRAMQTVQIFPGFSQHILDALQKKVASMPENSNLCAVVFDEMSIKEHVSYNVERDEVEGLEDFGQHGRTQHVANHATVFMARGILSKWKQAVGYVLSSGPISGDMLHSLLLDCIDKLESAGLNVKVVIADQGSNNRKVLETMLHASKEKPHFVHRGKTIQVMYDPPHLLKNIRNNLKKTGFKIGTKPEIIWEYIENLYNFDSQNQIRMAPKLTSKHIKLPPFAALSVKLAAQVLSHTVSSSLLTLIQFKVLPEEAKETAKFIEHFDQLFNTFNSGSMTSTQKMRHAITDSSGHVPFLEETLDWLETVETQSSRSLPCLRGWIMAIRSLLSLWEDLRDNHAVKFLFTSRLNQDCLENLFSVVRGKGGQRDNPSAKEFRDALRQIMVDSIIMQSKSSNCTEDADNSLLTFSTVAVPGIEPNQRAEVEQLPVVEASESELLWLISNPAPPPKSSQLQTVQMNVITYIAGYVAKKVQGKVCDNCRQELEGSLSDHGDNELFLQNKLYAETKGTGLTVPSENLVQVMTLLESTFSEHIDRVVYMDKVKTRLFIKLKGLGDGLLGTACSSVANLCPLQQLIVHLFINIRLHFSLKLSCRDFAARSARENRKLLKVSHR